MTTSQVTRRDSQTFIRLGRHDAPIPGPLADAAFQLITDGRSYRGAGSSSTTAWLFPGTCPAAQSPQPGSASVSGVLASTPRPGAALLDLGAQFPAAVLADLLGLHETTAARWMYQAGGDWSRYAAQLARSHPHQP
jgi:hypothetical protein